MILWKGGRSSAFPMTFKTTARMTDQTPSSHARKSYHTPRRHTHHTPSAFGVAHFLSTQKKDGVGFASTDGCLVLDVEASTN